MKNREKEIFENAQLLSMLSEPGELNEITFEYLRYQSGGAVRFRIHHYRFSPESLGIYNVSDLVKSKEDRHYGLPSTDRVYLFPLKNFHADIPCLSGIVNSRLGHYPKEGEIYVFINGGHKQLKVYYLSPNQERVYLYHLSEGTYDLPRQFEKQSYEQVNRTSLVRLLDCPKKRRKSK